MRICNKKVVTSRGFGLIEVVVALSILLLVLSSAITLIIAVVNLNMAARNKTEAVAFAQEGLTIGITDTTCNCYSDLPTTSKTSVRPESGQARYFRVVSYELGNINNAGDFSPLSSGDFIRITSLVQWFDRGQLSIPASPYNIPGSNKYQIVQIVRNNNE